MPGRPEDSGGDHSGMLRASLELDRAVGASVALDDVLPRMLDALLQIFPQAERALLLLVDPASGQTGDQYERQEYCETSNHMRPRLGIE